MSAQSRLAPSDALLRRGAQHPFAERVDQTRFLGQRNEDLRRDVSMLRVVPAQQRLRADDRLVCDAHHRLVVKLERVVLDGGAQRRFQRVLLQPALGEICVEELIGVAAQLLRAVHRHVGVLEQFLGRVAVVGVDRDTDRRGHVDVVLLDLEGLRHGILQLLRDAVEHARVVEVLDDDHEFVAAEARQQVGFAQAHAIAQR